MMLRLRPATKAILQARIKSGAPLDSTAKRALVVLLMAAGSSVDEISRQTGYSAPTVRKWRRRVLEGGTPALTDIARPGRRRVLEEDCLNHIVKETLNARGLFGPELTTRKLATRYNVSRQTVSRTWRTYNLGPKIQNVVEDLWPRLYCFVGMHLDSGIRAFILATTDCPHGSFRYTTSSPGKHALEETARFTQEAPTVNTLELLAFFQKLDEDVPLAYGVELILLRLSEEKIDAVLNWTRARPRWHTRFHFLRHSWQRPRTADTEISPWRIFLDLAWRKCRRPLAGSIDSFTTKVLSFVEQENPRKVFQWFLHE